MLKKLLITLSFVFLSLIFATPSEAHTLKTDGSIGAVIHISPEDDPIVGEPSDFFFEIKDKENKFSLSKCHCEALVVKDDRVIYSTSFSQHNGDLGLTSSSFSYTFPEKGIYKILVNGMPLESFTFKNFSLSYEIRVSRESEKKGTLTQTETESNPTQKSLPHYVILLAIFLIFLLVVFWNKIRGNKPRNDKPKPIMSIIAFLLVSSVTVLNLCYQSQILVKNDTHAHHAETQNPSHSEHQVHPCCTIQSAAVFVALELSPRIEMYSQTILLQPTAYYFENTKSIKNKSPPYFLS